MALINTWNRTNTSNRIITEDLRVRYSTEQVEYDTPTDGDSSQAPSYVTTAEAAVTTATTNLQTATTSQSSALDAVVTANTAANTAYTTWKASPTSANYKAYLTAMTTVSGCRRQLAEADALVSNYKVALETAETNLAAANERWASDRSDISYSNGKIVGYVYHRYATMKMRYVGFTLAAANACRSAYDTFLTRTISKSATFDDGQIKTLTQTYNPSTVSEAYARGDAYTIEIEVNEDDVKATTTLVSNPATLFTTENARNYHIES